MTEVRKTKLDQLRDMLIVEGIKDDLPCSTRRDQLQRAEDSQVLRRSRFADAKHPRQIAGAHLLIKKEVDNSSSGPVSESGEEPCKVPIGIPCLKDGAGAGDCLRSNTADLAVIWDFINHCVYA